MRDNDITILIAARNAATTIGRAIDSVMADSSCPIILVDDFSNDDTLAVARRHAGDRLNCVTPSYYGPLGLTRQTGLDAVETPIVMLLDADDVLLPGRIDRSLDAFQSSDNDVFVDGLMLYDGRTGEQTKFMPIPAFMRHSAVPVRLFERNYLPGIGQIAVRTELAKRVGYDTGLHGAEDVDLVLRMVADGARFHFDDMPGYAMYASPDSMSRDISRHRMMYRRCLCKFSYNQVRTLFREQGYSERTAVWALVSMATYREEYLEALAFVDEIETMSPIGHEEVLEPDGPSPFTEAWRMLFHRGTLLALLGEHLQAARQLHLAHARSALPEVCNNLAVAVGRLGQAQRRSALLEQALARYPAYADARRNAADAQCAAITTHPLRCHPARQDYG